MLYDHDFSNHCQVVYNVRYDHKANARRYVKAARAIRLRCEHPVEVAYTLDNASLERCMAQDAVGVIRRSWRHGYGILS